MPFYLLVSANRSCMRVSVHMAKILTLYVVILLYFLRQCVVGLVSLCEGFMTYAFQANMSQCVRVPVHMV